MSDPKFGVLASACYLPRLRLERSGVAALHKWMAPGLKSLARGHRSVANWDEDSITMGLEAARLVARSTTRELPPSLTLASTTLPFADRSNSGVIAAAMGLSAGAKLRDVTSTARAGLSELVCALEKSNDALVLAAERRQPRPASSHELIQGDGAAAVLVGMGDPVATRVASARRHADFVDHFRESGRDHDYGWEERWVRDEGYMKIVVQTVQECLTQAGVAPSDIAHFALPAPLPKVNEAVAKRVGFPLSTCVETAHETCGDLGSAQPLAMLDRALRQAQPGELILVAAFGNGCEVLLLSRTAVAMGGQLPSAGRIETNYMKYLSFTGQLELEWGMRAEIDSKTALTAAWRDHARAARFEGGRCSHCGTVQFPRSHVCVNPACNAHETQAAVSLAETPARVLSHTSDFLAYTPHPPFQFGHVDFDGGGRVLMEFADTDSGELSVGTPLRMVYRVKEFDRQRGFRRYFWKATPLRDEEGTA